MITVQQKIFALIASFSLLLIILELVRRRRIKEEYSWLWVAIGVIITALVVWQDLLYFLTRLIGAREPSTTLFLFGLLFLILINIHYSIKISNFTDQVKKLAQNTGLLSKKIEDFENSKEKK